MKYSIFTSLMLLCLCATAQSTSAQSTPTDLYSINADDVLVDNENNVITYKGNATVTVANLIIEAHSIVITSLNGLPLKIEATGDPIRFHEQIPKQNISGTATGVTFDVAELKLTLIEYSILDPSGNNMKGKKASFVLSP